MSTLPPLESPAEADSTFLQRQREEQRRKEDKLAAAKKKLKSFRARQAALAASGGGATHKRKASSTSSQEAASPAVAPSAAAALRASRRLSSTTMENKRSSLVLGSSSATAAAVAVAVAATSTNYSHVRTHSRTHSRSASRTHARMPSRGATASGHARGHSRTSSISIPIASSSASAASASVPSTSTAPSVRPLSFAGPAHGRSHSRSASRSGMHAFTGHSAGTRVRPVSIVGLHGQAPTSVDGALTSPPGGKTVEMVPEAVDGQMIALGARQQREQQRPDPVDETSANPPGSPRVRPWSASLFTFPPPSSTTNVAPSSSEPADGAPNKHTRRSSRHVRRTSVATRRESMEIMGGVGVVPSASSAPLASAPASSGADRRSGFRRLSYGASNSMSNSSHPFGSGSGSGAEAGPSTAAAATASGAPTAWDWKSLGLGDDDEDDNDDTGHRSGRESALAALEGRSRSTSPLPPHPLSAPAGGGFPSPSAVVSPLPRHLSTALSPSGSPHASLLASPRPTKRRSRSLSPLPRFADTSSSSDPSEADSNGDAVVLPDFDSVHGDDVPERPSPGGVGAASFDPLAELAGLAPHSGATNASDGGGLRRSSLGMSLGPPPPPSAPSAGANGVATSTLGSFSSPLSSPNALPPSDGLDSFGNAQMQALSGASPSSYGLHAGPEGLETLAEEEEEEESSPVQPHRSLLSEGSAVAAADGRPESSSTTAENDEDEEQRRRRNSRRLSLQPKPLRLKSRPASLYISPTLSPLLPPGVAKMEAKDDNAVHSRSSPLARPPSSVDDDESELPAGAAKGWSFARSQAQYAAGLAIERNSSSPSAFSSSLPAGGPASASAARTSSNLNPNPNPVLDLTPFTSTTPAASSDATASVHTATNEDRASAAAAKTPMRGTMNSAGASPSLSSPTATSSPVAPTPMRPGLRSLRLGSMTSLDSGVTSPLANSSFSSPVGSTHPTGPHSASLSTPRRNIFGSSPNTPSFSPGHAGPGPGSAGTPTRKSSISYHKSTGDSVDDSRSSAETDRSNSSVSFSLAASASTPTAAASAAAAAVAREREQRANVEREKRELEAALASANASNAASSSALAEAQARADRDASELAALRKQVERLTGELASQAERAAAEYAELERWSQEEKELAVRSLEELEMERDVLVAAAAESGESEQAELAAVKSELEETKQALEEAEMERDSLREDVEGWRGRVKDLEEKVQREKLRGDDEERLVGVAKRRIDDLARRLRDEAGLDVEPSETDITGHADILRSPILEAKFGDSPPFQALNGGNGGVVGVIEAVDAPTAAAPPPQTVQLLADMRQQIFTLAASLEKEREAHEQTKAEVVRVVEENVRLDSDLRRRADETVPVSQKHHPHLDFAADSKGAATAREDEDEETRRRHVFAYDSSVGSVNCRSSMSASLGSFSRSSATTVEEGGATDVEDSAAAAARPAFPAAVGAGDLLRLIDNDLAKTSFDNVLSPSPPPSASAATFGLGPLHTLEEAEEEDDGEEAKEMEQEKGQQQEQEQEQEQKRDDVARLHPPSLAAESYPATPELERDETHGSLGSTQAPSEKARPSSLQLQVSNHTDADGEQQQQQQHLQQQQQQQQQHSNSSSDSSISSPVGSPGGGQTLEIVDATSQQATQHRHTQSFVRQWRFPRGPVTPSPAKLVFDDGGEDFFGLNLHITAEKVPPVEVRESSLDLPPFVVDDASGAEEEEGQTVEYDEGVIDVAASPASSSVFPSPRSSVGFGRQAWGSVRSPVPPVARSARSHAHYGSGSSATSLPAPASSVVSPAAAAGRTLSRLSLQNIGSFVGSYFSTGAVTPTSSSSGMGMGVAAAASVAANAAGAASRLCNGEQEEDRQMSGNWVLSRMGEFEQRDHQRLLANAATAAAAAASSSATAKVPMRIGVGAPPLSPMSVATPDPSPLPMTAWRPKAFVRREDQPPPFAAPLGRLDFRGATGCECRGALIEL